MTVTRALKLHDRRLTQAERTLPRISPPLPPPTVGGTRYHRAYGHPPRMPRQPTALAPIPLTVRYWQPFG
eukprot:688713-Hanusia_phi.AAC.2